VPACAAHAAELDGGTDADCQLARDVCRFIDDMPVARPRPHELRAELEAVLAQRSAAEATRETPTIPKPARQPTKIRQLDALERERLATNRLNTVR